MMADKVPACLPAPCAHALRRVRVWVWESGEFTLEPQCFPFQRRDALRRPAVLDSSARGSELGVRHGFLDGVDARSAASVPTRAGAVGGPSLQVGDARREPRVLVADWCAAPGPGDCAAAEAATAVRSRGAFGALLLSADGLSSSSCACSRLQVGRRRSGWTMGRSGR